MCANIPFGRRARESIARTFDGNESVITIGLASWIDLQNEAGGWLDAGD